jgi:hypothetical protein
MVMPFGLTNAPATIQTLMNQLLHKYLRKFVLVFFDEILVYSKTAQEHQEHLQTVLEVLRKNKLFAKKSKCVFGRVSRTYYQWPWSFNWPKQNPSSKGLSNSIKPEQIPAELPCSSYSEDSRQAGKSSSPQNLTSLSILLELNLEALWRLNSHFLHTFCEEE